LFKLYQLADSGVDRRVLLIVDIVVSGCTHFIIGRDMAVCKSSITGEDFYGAYDAQDTATANAPELGMQTVLSLNITYTEVWYLGLCLTHCAFLSTSQSVSPYGAFHG
jgi:hypothetical protein